MTLYNLMKEIDYHEQLLKVVLEYQCNDGICRVHYTNIRERGVFPKILYLFTEKIAYPERYNDEYRLQEKYNLKKKTVQIFTGYLGMTYK